MTAVYYLFCAASVLLAWFADRKNTKIAFLLSTLLICIIAGFRARSVGIDTDGYYQYIEWVQMGVLENVEIGFIYFTELLLLIIDLPEFVVAVYSIITVICIFTRLWTMRRVASYPLMVLIYLAFYLQLSMNIMRQFFAISIVFLATLLLEKRRYILYLASVVFAFLFHSSAILGIIIFVVYYWINNTRSVKRLLLVTLLTLASPIALSVTSELIGKYAGYFETSSVDIGLIIFAKLAVVVAFITFNRHYIFSNEDEDDTPKIVTILYIVGLVLTFAGYIFSYMERLGFIFMMFEPICLAIMCKRNYGDLFRIVVLGLVAFVAVMSYTSNGNGVFPYEWIL